MQFYSFNSKIKSAPKTSEKISVDAKPTQPISSFKPDVREETHEIAVSKERETRPGDNDSVRTPSVLEV